MLNIVLTPKETTILSVIHVLSTGTLSATLALVMSIDEKTTGLLPTMDTYRR